MTVSPIEYRYGREETKAIFSEESRLLYMLKVEAAITRAEEEFGLVPRGTAEMVERAALSGRVTLEKVKAVEAETGHDIMALTRVLSQEAGEAGRYVHLGATSNDIIDTATALQIKDFLGIYEGEMVSFILVLSDLVQKYRSVPMLGRTHGQHASPITFGLKVAVFCSEMMRHLERLREMRKRVLVGKLLGPVGTGASLGPDALRIQERAMQILGLGVEEGATQIVGRDRYIEFLGVLSNVASSLEKFATEVRNLQRPEIGEVSEYFDESRQVGSSSMPSKRNPVSSENVASLARLVRSFIVPEFEAAVTWHERDLTNSALERFTIPYSAILSDYILHRMKSVFQRLQVNVERMEANLLSDPFVVSERLVTELTERGMPRQEAHEVVRRASMESYRTGRPLRSTLRDLGVLRYMSDEELERISDPRTFTGSAEEICDRTVSRVREMVGHEGDRD